MAINVSAMQVSGLIQLYMLLREIKLSTVAKHESVGINNGICFETKYAWMIQ